MTDPNRFVLSVTGGPSYDTTTHKPIAVNTSEPLTIASSKVDSEILVRIKDYRGLPKDSPSSCAYFESSVHPSDRVSIAFNFRLKEDLNGSDLVFGNDFDHPIRDRLPWGFSTAFNFVKKFIDPGIDGDVYADEPYLYGPLLSSINIFRIGGTGAATGDSGSIDTVLEEGGEQDGEKIRETKGIPEDAAARKSHFLQEGNRKDFQFEAGRTYKCDFFNPYLDFNEFALKLPVITIPIVKYWDGQPLRYVLKNIKTNEELFVIVLTLLPAESLEDTDSDDDVDSNEGDPEKDNDKPTKGNDDNDDVD